MRPKRNEHAYLFRKLAECVGDGEAGELVDEEDSVERMNHSYAQPHKGINGDHCLNEGPALDVFKGKKSPGALRGPCQAIENLLLLPEHERRD